MGKFKKLFNYYLSAYWNNPRTLSSMYSFLKIFFERNNKIDSTVSSFGNVFRNSKWSNLQVQNIKKLFIKQWVSFFLIILFTFLFLFTFADSTLSLTYLIFFYCKQTINELLTNFYYFLGCILYQFFSYFNSLFLSNQTKIVKNSSVGGTPYTKNVNNDINFNSPQSLQKSSYLNIFFLQKTLPLLNNLNIEPSTNNSLNSNPDYLNLNTSFSTKVQYLTISNSLPTRVNISSLTFNELPYVLSPKLNKDFSTSVALSTTLDNLYRNEEDFNVDPMLTETLTHGYNNIAKQQRWLTRNFWSNQSFVEDSNLITQSKTFIQNPLLSNTALDTNIWLSNKLSGIETENVSLIFNQLASNSNLLSVFNTFDSSRFFLNQRYSFLNRLDNQVIINSVSKSSLTHSNNSSSIIDLKLTLLQSYFTRNLVTSTFVYTSSLNNTEQSNNVNKGFTEVFNSDVHNLFIATTFSDLLQQNDLQSLNTINSSVNNSNKLYLNRNFNPSNSFKS